MHALVKPRSTEITGLPQYDQMITLIATCHEVDEVKELRDQALALETYAKQALNTHAERQAVEIRIRAERRAGELLNLLQSNKGGDRKSEDYHFASTSQPAKLISPREQARQVAGISNDQASKWQRLAEIPAPVFEQALSEPERKPSTTGLIERNRNNSQAPDDVLWFWGRLRDFERDGYFTKNINHLVSEMSDAMQSDVRRLVPQLQEWLGGLED
jgi:hypothetical protein